MYMSLVCRTTFCTRWTRTTLSSEIRISYVSHMAEFVCCLPETDISSVEIVSHMLETQMLSELYLICDRSNVN
jgi:hypothetical protein